MELEPREILFRGKHNNLHHKWIIGKGVHFFNSCATIIIKCSNSYGHRDQHVIPETVTQYIGRKDCESKRIFEGDIIHIDNCFGVDEFNWVIKWDYLNTRFALARKRLKSPDWGARDDGYIYFQLPPEDIKRAKILGNIFDNPELLNQNA